MSLVLLMVIYVLMQKNCVKERLDDLKMKELAYNYKEPKNASSRVSEPEKNCSDQFSIFSVALLLSLYSTHLAIFHLEEESRGCPRSIHY